MALLVQLHDAQFAHEHHPVGVVIEPDAHEVVLRVAQIRKSVHEIPRRRGTELDGTLPRFGRRDRLVQLLLGQVHAPNRNRRRPALDFQIDAEPFQVAQRVAQVAIYGVHGLDERAPIPLVVNQCLAEVVALQQPSERCVELHTCP